MWLYKRTPLFLMTFKSSSKLRSTHCDNFNYFITSLYVQCAYTILNVERSEVRGVRGQKGGAIGQELHCSPSRGQHAVTRPPERPVFKFLYTNDRQPLVSIKSTDKA